MKNVQVIEGALNNFPREAYPPPQRRSVGGGRGGSGWDIHNFFRHMPGSRPNEEERCGDSKLTTDHFGNHNEDTMDRMLTAEALVVLMLN